MLARSERDGIHPVEEPVALGRLAIVAIEREILARPNLQIRFLGSHDAATDVADEGMVAHVLRNLLDNAIRHGGMDGPIEVVIDASTDEVVVRIVHCGDAPVPNGDAFGLSREPATAAGRSGAGIALYVARRLVEAMHGRIWAVSAPPAGAEFGFALQRFGPGRTMRPAWSEADRPGACSQAERAAERAADRTRLAAPMGLHQMQLPSPRPAAEPDPCSGLASSARLRQRKPPQQPRGAAHLREMRARAPGRRASDSACI